MPSAMIKTIRSNAKPYVLTSVGGTTADDDGYQNDAAGTPATVQAHIQPMGTKDLRNVPEGQNTLQWIVIWSESELIQKHKITYGNVVFTIQKVEFWDDGAFYKAAAVHVED